MNERFKWTKEKIKKVIEMWPDHDIAEIAVETGASNRLISNLALRIRRRGYPLSPKQSPNVGMGSIIQSAIDEINFNQTNYGNKKGKEGESN